MKKKDYLDAFEEEIEKNIHRYKKTSASRKKNIEAIIDRANERKVVSLRLNNFDLDQIKIKAEEQGVPYQTFISSILHKYVTDQFVDQKEVLKSIKLLRYGT